MPYICERCGYTCDAKSKLDRHMNKQIPCISEKDNDSSFKCDFCHNGFASYFNLKRHNDSCVVRKNPELLLKYIEKQKELYDKIIGQKDEIIEQLKEAKPNITVDGDHAKIDASINSINNIDNSTNITNNNNITLIEQPLAFRSADMVYLLQHHEADNESEFWILAKNIRDAMKRGDLDGMINSLLTYIHNNKKLKEGQNIRYCPDGKHKGELLIYDYDDKGVGYWRPSDVRPITSVLSKEFEFINQRQDEKNKDNEDSPHTRENNTKKEEKFIGQLGYKAEHLHEDLSIQDAVVKFIKKFRISDVVPENIRDNVLEDDHPLNNKTSGGVNKHKEKMREQIKLKKSERRRTKAAKSKKINDDDDSEN
jgi:hypothetical protein